MYTSHVYIIGDAEVVIASSSCPSSPLTCKTPKPIDSWLIMDVSH